MSPVVGNPCLRMWRGSGRLCVGDQRMGNLEPEGCTQIVGRDIQQSVDFCRQCTDDLESNAAILGGIKTLRQADTVIAHAYQQIAIT
jgi:hypothetical protein